MARTHSRSIGRVAALLVQLVAGTVVLVGFLALAEFLCGFFVVADAPAGVPIVFQSDDGDFVSKAVRFLDQNPIPSVPDIDLAWSNRPGASTVVPLNPQAYGRRDTWAVRINSEGFRGPERAFAATRPDGYRILFIGDSVTYGYSVEESASFVRRVEAALRARYPDRQFDVIDAGVPGWTWVQGLRFLELRGLALQPDLVVMAHGANDQFFPAKVTDEERLRALRRPGARLRERVRALVSDTNMFRFASRWVPPSPAPQGDSPGCVQQIRETGNCKRVALREIEAAMDEARALTAQAGADLLVMNLDFNETPAADAMRRAASADHLRFLDFVRDFAARRADDEHRREVQFHLAPAGAVAASPEQAARGGGEVLLRVASGGLTGQFGVSGAAFPFGNLFSFEQRLVDDGTHGDEVARDGVFSTTVTVPPGVSDLRYLFLLDGAPEFASPEGAIPSQFAYRPLRPLGDTRGPVDGFGLRYLMVENTHPDAAGHALIADGILAVLPSIPSFGRFVASRRGS